MASCPQASWPPMLCWSSLYPMRCLSSRSWCVLSPPLEFWTLLLGHKITRLQSHDHQPSSASSSGIVRLSGPLMFWLACCEVLQESRCVPACPLPFPKSCCCPAILLVLPHVCSVIAAWLSCGVRTVRRTPWLAILH